jgi:SAM-dependent methyltransferase
VTNTATAPGEIAAALQRRLPAALAPLFDGAFIQSCILYDEFISRLALAVVRAAGLEPALRESGSAAEIATRTKLDTGGAVVPLDCLLRQLAARQVLAVETADGVRRFHLRGALPTLDPAAVRDEQARHDPSWLPSYVLAETVAADYPAFLRGEVSGEAILFSPARLRLWVEYFSNRNGLYAVNNRVGAIAVDEWLPRGPATILELGGGLGSAAVALLERVGASGRLGAIREYHFTEIVPAFLRSGQQVLERQCPGVSGLTFGRLDMNARFEAQGVAPGSVSVVYAVNTLHVAHDLAFTLGEVVRALEPGGQLIVSECVRPYPDQAVYAEFIFNLVETFRSPRLQPDWRPNGGFLTPEQWTAALTVTGFRNVQWLPDIAALRADFPAFYVAAIGATRP